MPPGHRPISRGCNSTTTINRLGTPAPRAAGINALETLARNTIFLDDHGVQPRLPQPDGVPPRARGPWGAASNLPAFEHAVRLWTIVLEILRADGPSSRRKRSRAPLLRLPHPRPRLRQSRRALDGRWACLMTALPARAIGSAITALMTGSSYATSAENGGRTSAPSPVMPRNRAAMLRVIRNHRRAGPMAL